MSTDAVAAVKIPITKLRAALGASPGETEALVPGCETLRGHNGALLLAKGLGDATLIYTRASLHDTDPDQIAMLVRGLLGELLDEHADARGLLVFPDAVKPKAGSWQELVDEIAELGDWAPIVSVSDAAEPALPGGLQAIATQLMSALGPDLGTLQQSLLSGDPNALEDAQRKIQDLLMKPEGAGLMQALGQLDLDGTMRQAKELFGEEGEPDTDVEPEPRPAPKPEPPKR